jgi:RNA polymerase sigma factor (sigma-70 family)
MGEDNGSRFKVAIVSKVKHGALWKFMKDRGWNQRKFSEYLGVDQVSLGRWINLKECPKSETTLKKLEELTDMTRFELFPEFLESDRWKDFLNATMDDLSFKEANIEYLGDGMTRAIPSTESEAIKNERREVPEILGKILNKQQYKVCVLRFMEELSHEEIAGMLGISIARVGQIERRLLETVRCNPRVMRHLRQYDFEGAG